LPDGDAAAFVASVEPLGFALAGRNRMGWRQLIAGHLQEAEDAYKGCRPRPTSFCATTDNAGGLFYMVDCTTGVMMTQIATGQLAAEAIADQLVPVSSAWPRQSVRRL
jgi:hypothetical protein